MKHNINNPIIILTVALLVASCQAVGERTIVSVGYYTVTGDTFNELDREIKLHGPNVTGVGKALASTDLRIQPDIRYDNRDGKCTVSKARINVQARVTLPRHANEQKLKDELALAWNNLEQYARVHEAVHLAIADRYALLMEDSIKALEAQKNCSVMRKNVQSTFQRLFQRHHAEQLQFDADEKKRIRRLAAKASSNKI